MKLATIQWNEQEQAAIVCAHGWVLIETLNQHTDQHWHTHVYDLIVDQQLPELEQWVAANHTLLHSLPALAASEIKYAPLYRHPRKIWGIGMNYTTDGSIPAQRPEEAPVSFMKPDTALIGHQDSVLLPSKQTTKVTAEAELAIIIGETCRHVPEQDALGKVAGYAVSLDMTAADIHAQNHRFLARAKSFDTFFGYGSELVTPADIASLEQLQVATWLNGQLQHQATIAQMLYSPAYIISFLSEVMTLLPGDIIMTGTPGSVVIQAGDQIECRITGFQSLQHDVREE